MCEINRSVIAYSRFRIPLGIGAGCAVVLSLAACDNPSSLPDLQHDPAAWATASYHESREQERERVERALLLYALGSVSLSGLGAIVLKRLPWWAMLAVWTLTGVAGVGIAQFIRVVPDAHSPIVFLIVYIPFGIAVVAALAACLTLSSRMLKTSSEH